MFICSKRERLTPDWSVVTAALLHCGRLLLVGLLLSCIPASSTYALDFPEPTQPEVWLMTYGPGDLYWERFGHNSIWIRDAEQGIDHTFNFGFFDFEQPGFIRRFVQGRMLYFGVAQQPVVEMQQYEDTGRSIRAQRLDMTPVQIRNLERYLVNQVQPENREYLYDYFYANCSTRLRDALDLALEGALSEATTKLPAQLNIRAQVNRLSWPDPLLFLGLQTALGSPIDVAASRWDEAFVPGQLADLVAEFRFADGKALVTDTIHDGARANIALPGVTQVWERYLAFGAILAVLLLIPYLRTLQKRRPARSFPFFALVWPLLAGASGCFLLYLWLGTNHAAAAQNWNLLILNPVLLPLSIWLLRKRTIAGNSILTFVMVVGWFAGAAAWLFLSPGQDNASVLALSLPLICVSAWVLAKNLRGTAHRTA